MENLLILMLPAELLGYFELDYFCELCNIAAKEEDILIDLREKHAVPSGYDPSEYESKDFMSRVIVQDFPLRGKSIYYSIRKQRWGKKSDKKQVIRRDFTFLTEGTRLRADPVSFLKDTGREASRYDEAYL